MPLKKEYPRYFQGSEDKSDIICFPAEGSLGTVYYLDIKRWASKAIWSLSEMKTPPVDVEILRWQAIALGVPSALPPSTAENPLVECDACGQMTPDNVDGVCTHCS